MCPNFENFYGRVQRSCPEDLNYCLFILILCIKVNGYTSKGSRYAHGFPSGLQTEGPRDCINGDFRVLN